MRLAQHVNRISALINVLVKGNHQIGKQGEHPVIANWLGAISIALPLGWDGYKWKVVLLSNLSYQFAYWTFPLDDCRKSRLSMYDGRQDLRYV
jgi:hypothetical protein